MLGFIGLTVVGGGGYLGGHMAFRQASGANHAESVPHLVSPGWHRVGLMSKIPQHEPVKRHIGDVPVLVHRDGEHVDVLADACPHLAAPLSDVPALAALLALEIEAHPPPAGVVGVAISAHVVPRRAAATDLWQPPAPAPRELAGVLARLTTLVGGANVGAPVALDSHRPDATTLTTFSGEPGPPIADGARADANTDRRVSAETPADGPPSPEAAQADVAAGALALRRLRPPRMVSVEVHDGRPARVTDSAAGRTLAVVTCAGPWRISGDWWDVDVWARDEWDVALTDDTVWRLAHNRLTSTWSLDGVYD